MIIRHEKPTDFKAIAEVAIAAFEDHAFSQQTERLIIEDLREAGALTVSLVAVVNDKVVGHIASSPVTISDGSTDWYGLGPVSVQPEYQCRRIGTALVNKGLDILKYFDGKGCALVGEPTYYFRFGFKNNLKLIHEGIPQEVFLVKPLNGQPVPSGTVEFHDASKQLSVVEKEIVTDAIIDWTATGVKADPTDPTIQSLIAKGILIEGYLDSNRFIKFGYNR
jgi:predicted N-acetyltransferase YhbS